MAQVTLGQISLMTQDYLDHIGWTNNPIVDILYSMTSAGVWIARTNTSGQETEANSTNTTNRVMALTLRSTPTVSVPDSSGRGGYARRIAQIALNTDGSGNCAATPLHTGQATYYPVVRLRRIISSVADASTELNVTVTGGGLVGPAQIIIALQAGIMLELNGQLLYNLTDETTISIAIANGPISGTIWLEIEYWSET